jgi:pimeloyl-ACP methyl ester carboxylesterase
LNEIRRTTETLTIAKDRSWQKSKLFEVVIFLKGIANWRCNRIRTTMHIARLLLLLALTLSSFATASSGGSCRAERLDIPAPSIGTNLVGESATQPLYVYLPASYDEGAKRYPVLYFFSGYWMGADIGYVTSVLPDCMKDGEFILVSVNAWNVFRGTFGANSPVTGNWGDFYANDVVPAVDAHYRTIPDRNARAVGGTSMGGHIAIRMAFGHPEMFAHLYALSPGVFAPDGLERAWPFWDRDFLNAYGAAYAPNPAKPFPHADIPTMDGSEADLAIRARWNKGFGELPRMLESYLAGRFRLGTIVVEVGTEDEYPWIPEGCSYFSNLMRENGIAHTLAITSNGHDFSPEIFASGMGPCVAKAFAKVLQTR